MITENDKLIAEFMGYTFSDDKRIDNTECWADTMRGMQYDTSWDCLIPVVQRIEVLCGGVPREMLNVSLYSDIKDVYQAVIEFIKECGSFLY